MPCPLRKKGKTKDEAHALLIEDLKPVEKAIEDLVIVRLNQNQYDALASFMFNVGIGAFRRSTMRKLLNKKDYRGAAGEFNKWIYGGGERLTGLVKRRLAEQQLFLT